ncbi:MAG: hypothetical protein EA427_17270 [Spirochaetaceae bacterium]|nr:MAG: hypothetical protein EA427_17270 [Spirochaetaceae bacterium]
MESPEKEADLLFRTSVSWLYTRTGRAFLETGLSYYPIFYREPSFGESPEDEVEREFFRELLGGDEFTMHVFGALLGVGWRFGALPRRPWELSFRYHLDRYKFPDGLLGDEDPLWGHGFSISFSRSFGFGGEYLWADTEAPGTSNTGRYVDAKAARAAAEENWQPSRLAVFVDPGGVLGSGARFGLEWRLADRWWLSAWGRQYISESRFSSAGLLQRVHLFEDWLIPDGYVLPGIGVRRYFRDDGRGWYAGGLVELISFRSFRGHDNRGFDGKTVELDGRLVMPQLEGGYRLPIWRSLSLDVGVQAGITTGRVDQISYLGSPGVDAHHEPWGSEPWYNVVISISTPIF